MLEDFRAALRSWKGVGIHSLRRNLFAVTSSEDEQAIINRDTLIMVAGKVGIPPNYIEKFYGQVDVETFCDRLIIPLSERAQDILDKVWSLVDFNDTDEADLEELRQRYDSRRWHNGCIYIGRYTDPNHPGGLRDFRLLDEVDSECRRKA